MQAVDTKEHLACFNYDQSERLQIEIVNYNNGETAELTAKDNEVIFLMEGRIRYVFDTYPECEVGEGNILFLPMGYRFICNPLSDIRIVIFRLYDPIRLCERYSIEKLFNSENDNNSCTRILKTLEIKPQIWHFITGLTSCIEDGVKCRHYFEMKIKEFFLMLRMYYPKSELRDFFGMILSSDVSFSEYVRSNRNKYSTVKALAESMHLTKKQFNKRFKNVFDRTPHGWMKEGRTQAILGEVTETEKPFKQIAFENGFKSFEEFTRFCKKEIGSTPTQLRDKKRP
jgi:AraC-type DNA-binding domain-containing proteins